MLDFFRQRIVQPVSRPTFYHFIRIYAEGEVFRVCVIKYL